MAAAGRKRGIQTATLIWTVAAMGGWLVAWIFFYYTGVALSRIPSTFHSGGPQ